MISPFWSPVPLLLRIFNVQLLQRLGDTCASGSLLGAESRGNRVFHHFLSALARNSLNFCVQKKKGLTNSELLQLVAHRPWLRGLIHHQPSTPKPGASPKFLVETKDLWNGEVPVALD